MKMTLSRKLSRAAHPRRVVLLVLVMLAALAVRPALAADDAAPPDHGPRPVITEIVSADPTDERAFPGIIEASHEVQLAFQTIGRIARLDVSPGDVVSEGDVLAVLDRVSLQEDLRAAEAALASARAEAEFAEQSYSRTRALADRDIASQATVEQVEAQRNATAAKVVAAEADLAAAEDALTYGSLTAPMDGVVLSTEVEAGAVVSAGTTVLTVAELAGREAVIDVPTEFLSLLPSDAMFELRRHAGSAAPVPARLRLVEPVADDILRGRRLRLAIEGNEGAFRIGSLITATYAAESEPVITLPLSAIAGREGAPEVWRVTPGSRVVHPVPVTPGVRIGDRIEIRSGIEVGDEVIVKGARSLEDGQTVGAREE
ncbi:efflux RND transporter periplasmic adaptor subunit [Oceanicola sp. S124]|uniref:efflux RND transporter periplasmic adaptor subunit n=1 Tax=Oceanicola sp. S124 TaxID=1042378 RepID=UPI0002558184|nr:efflux RND transporter periplasmic adaptor subunit [Oceanicola sp. S124]